jgi:hypothetical protein
MKALSTILFVLLSLVSNANTIVLKPNNGPVEYYFPHGGVPLADTIKIAPGNYVSIILTGIFGNGKPVVIDGANVHADFMRVDSSAYFTIQHFDLGKPGEGQALTVELCSHYRITNNSVHDADVGIYCKKNPSADPFTQYPNYLIDDVEIDSNHVYHTNGEGMYIGHTYPNGDPYNGGLIPVRMRNVRIHHNRVENTGWDAIQLSNATDNCSIHDNQITSYGTLDVGSQRAGIIMGANTNGDVYNNTIDGGTGNCIQLFTYGHSNLYNNVIRGGTTLEGTEQSIFTKSVVNIETRPVQTVDVFNNTIIEPQVRGILNANNDLGQCDSTIFQNNKIQFKDSIPSNWPAMISTAAPNKLISGNTASVENLIILPTSFLNVEAALLNDHQLRVSFVASQVDAKEFFIELSTDGIHFKKVAVIVPDTINPNKLYTQIIEL